MKKTRTSELPINNNNYIKIKKIIIKKRKKTQEKENKSLTTPIIRGKCEANCCQNQLRKKTLSGGEGEKKIIKNRNTTIIKDSSLVESIIRETRLQNKQTA